MDWLVQNTSQNIRKLVKDGFIIRKQTKIHSRSCARLMKEAKTKGRHTGYGICSTQPLKSIKFLFIFSFYGSINLGCP